jgi:multidrug resistance efflux pump
MEKTNYKNNLEKKILKEEREILTEVREEKSEIKNLKRNIYITAAAIVLILGGGIVGFTYWQVSSARIYIDMAEVSAPVTNLAASVPGVLKDTYVQAGDTVAPLSPVALVGDSLAKTETGGLIISVQNDIGKIFGAGEPVASMIDPSALRIVGQVDENKGLSDIRVGQKAIFTVDAFGSKTYTGVVDEISPTSRDSGVVFSISDKREVKVFDIKVRFDTTAYPELSNGMSARIWIYK